MDITIAVACYNEQHSIIPTLANIMAALDKLTMNAEIIVMDDASTDDSVKLVRDWIEQNHYLNVRLNVNVVNEGLECNVFKAVALSQCQYFWVVAGDNAIDVETYIMMLSNVGKADIIIPYVLYYDGRSVFRKMISSLYVMIVNWLSGYKIKYYNGSSIYLRDDIRQYGAGIKGFSYSAELIIKLLDHDKSFIEVPVVFNDRKHGKSTAVSPKNFKAVVSFFLRLIKRKFTTKVNHDFNRNQNLSKPYTR